jgi:hypothetical protein
VSKREYPYYAGREKYHGKPKDCECCMRFATHIVSMQLSIFRGDDECYLVCEKHAMAARMNYEQFVAERTRQQHFMCETVNAQHVQTGRVWSGERRNLPPRYFVVPVREK